MAENSIEPMSPDSDGILDDKELLTTIDEMWTSAKKYRDTFSDAWSEITDQINLNEPADWALKEEWQTKIMTPEQFKIAETATSNIMSMLFGTDKFFGVLGVDDMDKMKVTYLLKFMMILLREGNFFQQNGYAMHEAVELGTSFIKRLVNKKKQSIDFSFRTVKDIVFDPESYTSFENCKFVIEEYDMNVFDIVKTERFSKNGINTLLKNLQRNSNPKSKDLLSIISSEGDSNFKLESKYQVVTLREFWGYLPVKKTKTVDGEPVDFIDHEWRTITTVAGENIILINAKSAYDKVPYERIICRRRRDHAYGYGFCYHLRGMQNYINSLINLGFDSTKISSMPIMKKDGSGIKDESTIEIKPLAVWDMKENRMDAAEVVNFQVNSMPDALMSIQQADTIIQDASGINRYAQGADTLFGKGEEALGQTQLKLQSMQRRMLKISKEMAEDYVIPLINSIFNIITSKEFVGMFQKKADRCIGTYLEPNPVFIQGIQSGINYNVLLEQGIQPQVEISKLDLRNLGKMNLDFTPLALTNYIQKTEQLERINQLLQMVSTNPTLAPFVNIDATMNRWAAMQEIDDYKELFTTKQQRQEALGMLQKQKAMEEANTRRHEIMRDREKAEGKIKLQEAKVKGLKETREHEVIVDTLKEEILGDKEDNGTKK